MRMVHDFDRDAYGGLVIHSTNASSADMRIGHIGESPDGNPVSSSPAPVNIFSCPAKAHRHTASARRDDIHIPLKNINNLCPTSPQPKPHGYRRRKRPSAMWRHAAPRSAGSGEDARARGSFASAVA